MHNYQANKGANHTSVLERMDPAGAASSAEQAAEIHDTEYPI